MARKRKARTLRRALGLAILALLFALLWPLNAFFAGLLPGGGRQPDPDRPREETREGGSLRVTVLERDTHEPVEGATILVHGARGTTLQAVSGKGGDALLTGIPEDLVRIEAKRGEGRDSVWAKLDMSERVALTVAPPGQTRGTVVHPDGRPAKALVRLVDSSGRELERMRTGDDGLFEFAEHREAIALTAESDSGITVSPLTDRLVLENGERTQGRLVGARAGVLDVFALAPARKEDALLPLRTTWEVDENGNYGGRLPKGTLAWGMYEGLPVVLNRDEAQLPERTTLRGTVTRSDGRPVGRATLRLSPELDAAWIAPIPPRVIEVVDDGAFEVAGLGSVPYRIIASANGCATRIFDDVDPKEGAIRIELSPGFAVAGSVVDSRGVPLARATVHAEGLPDPRAQRPAATTASDERGKFRLDGMGGDFARVRVTAQGHHPTTLENVRPTDSLRVVLQPR